MRTRNNKKQYWLSDEESNTLEEKVSLSGLNESIVIRRMIMDTPIREKPDESFYESFKELRAIGNNLNQIAHKCNALGVVDPIYQEEADKLNKFIIDIKKKYLL